MEALSAADLLDIWERAAPLGPLERTLALLGRARPDLPDDALPAVTIGRRDSDLLELRRATFGDRMTAIVDCPECATRLEFDIDASEVVGDGPAAPPDRPLRIQVGDRELVVRAPTTEDLVRAMEAAATVGHEPVTMRRELLRRLVVDGWRAGADEDLEEELEAAVAEAILQADPGTEIRLSFVCTDCGTGWQAMLDVPSYLWTEVEACARRVAQDVSGLAAAYGWREGDVLELTPWRRRLYLELAAG